jgi:hypothetical protein
MPLLSVRVATVRVSCLATTKRVKLIMSCSMQFSFLVVTTPGDRSRPASILTSEGYRMNRCNLMKDKSCKRKLVFCLKAIYDVW